MTDEVRLPYLTDETDMLPREIHAIGSDWFHAELQYLRESSRPRNREHWGNVALVILFSACIILIGWSAAVYGATQLWNWVLP